MDHLPEYSLILVQILAELETKHNTMPYQDLCEFLCADFNIVQLAKLRSLLFYTACLDPPFPADVFKDKMCCFMQDPQSKKRMVVADIVAIFNLIQMNRGIAKGKLPIVHRATFRRNQSVDLCRSDHGSYQYEESERGLDHEHWDGQHHHNHRHLQQYSTSQSTPPCSKFYENNNNGQQFITIDPNFFLCVSKDLTCRVASLDKLPQYDTSSSLSPSCEMQNTYSPLNSKSTTESLQHSRYPEPFFVHSFVQKRSVSKEGFNDTGAFSSQNRQRVKHKNLEELQASTRCGSTTPSECISNRARKQLLWPVKSLRPKRAERPPDFDRSHLSSKPLQENHNGNYKIISVDNEQHFQSPEKQVFTSTSCCAKKANGIRHKDPVLIASEPVSLEKREAIKKLNDKTINSPSFQEEYSSSSVWTQTEQAEQERVKEYQAKYNERERHAFKHVEGDSEIFSDDISDIFKFLDDMSVCDSLGVAESSCFNSHGSLSQVTLKSEGDSYQERNAVKLAKSKLDRLFHSLENTDDELRSSVCKLMMRVYEIEKKLESLWGIPNEISHVLSKINMLADRIQEPKATAKCKEMVSVSGPSATLDEPQPHSHLHHNITMSPFVFQGHTTGQTFKMDKATSGECCYSNGGNSSGLRLKPLKMSMSIRRWSHSLNKEESGTESKVASFTSPLVDWRKNSYPYHCGYEDKDRGRNSKDGHSKAQTQECLNPNNLEYWMEDIYTPGYDSLLKRKTAEFWRAKVFKIGALIAASICSVIVVIIVPICIMKNMTIWMK